MKRKEMKLVRIMKREMKWRERGSKEKTNWKRNEMGQEQIERDEMKGNRTGLVNMKWNEEANRGLYR